MIASKVWAKLSRRLKLDLALVALLLTYVGSYSILSANGGYVFMPSGEIRYSFGLSVQDQCLWQPRYGHGQWFRQISGNYSFRGDFIGMLYYPLIRVDQIYFHPTIRSIAIRGEPATPLEEAEARYKVHPEYSWRY